MEQAIGVLAAAHASEASRVATLGILESVLDHGVAFGDIILRPHMRQLLESLRVLVTSANSSRGAQFRPKRLRPGQKVCITCFLLHFPSAGLFINLKSSHKFHMHLPLHSKCLTVLSIKRASDCVL